MQRKPLAPMQCPIARSVDRIGDAWSILILRDVSQGVVRFEQIQTSLGIGPAVLSKRLQALVEDGLLERHRYSTRPPRDEYRLTERGQDFHEVLWALAAFGNKHFATEGKAMLIVDRATGIEADPVLVDRATGRPLTRDAFRSAAGPAANERMRMRHAPSQAAAPGAHHE